MADWIPNYIRKNINYKPHEVISAKEFNAILNLVITQGDYNSGWLEYLQNSGIPDAVKDIAETKFDDIVEDVVKTEIDLLATSVTNKTSAYLNDPVFAFVDLSVQSDTVAFKTLMDSNNISASFCVATNLIGKSDAYPTLQYLKQLLSSGHSLITVGTDGASFDSISEEAITNILNNSKNYMATNLADSDVFLYPNGNTSVAATHAVKKFYRYAVNINNEDIIDSDDVLGMLYNIPVLYLGSDTSVEALTTVIDEIVLNNMCCIFAVDSSSSNYNETVIQEVINYINNYNAKYTSVSEALHLCENTINNKIKAITNMAYVDNIDYNGNVSDDKYLHW